MVIFGNSNQLTSLYKTREATTFKQAAEVAVKKEKAFYKLNDDVADASGNAYTGTLTGAGYAAGLLNDCLLFGNNNVDNLSVPAAVLNGATDFSLACWIKFNSIKEIHTLITCATAAVFTEIIFFHRRSTHTFEITVKNTLGSYVSAAPENSLWHHVVLTRSGQAVALYVDNALVDSHDLSAVALSVDAGGLIIGQYQQNLGDNYNAVNSFDGYVDDLRFYRIVLSLAQRTFLYNAGAGTESPVP